MGGSLEDELPVVDAAALREASSAEDPAVRSLRRACCETGFFLVTGHSVPEAVFDNAFSVSERFFTLTEADKRAHASSEETGWRGFGPYGSGQNCSAESRLPDRKETFYCGEPPGADQGVPEPVERFYERLRDFHAAMLDLSRTLLRGLSLGLGLAPDHFERLAFQKPVAKVLLASYPPAADGELSCGAHTDCGFLTLVCQDGSDGLQVQRSDGTWLAVRSSRYMLVANLGDLAQLWTNDVYRSSPHRVLNSSGLPRRSLVFFNNLDEDAEAACSDLLELSLGSASGEVEPAELLFFSAAWRDPQHLFQELATYGLQAERYILVHAASTAASNSLEGGIDAWLQSPGANGWSLLEHTLLGGGLAVLGLSPPAWSTTNATRSGGSCDPTRAMRSRRALREARSMASELLILNGNYPGMWAGSWRLDEQKVEAVRQQLSLAVRLCPSDSKDALAARKVLRRSFLGQDSSTWPTDENRQPKRLTGPPLTATEELPGSPELMLLLLDPSSSSPALSDVRRESLLEEAVQRWPHYKELWQLLAPLRAARAARSPEEHQQAGHAWRRCLALAGRDRFVVRQAITGLQELGFGQEAATVWDTLAGGSRGVAGALWDDPRRYPMNDWIPAIAAEAPVFPHDEFMKKHPEFQDAKDLFEQYWEPLRDELLQVIQDYKPDQVNGYCKDNGWCENVFLAMEGCGFISFCFYVPSLCQIVEQMEAQGLRVLRASASFAGSNHAPGDTRPLMYIKPHASHLPGRLRMSCTVVVSEGTSSTIRLENEEPRVYQAGRCFWFDESRTHEMDFAATGNQTLRATLYVDALHPGYYEHGSHQVEVSHEPFSFGWWQNVLARDGSASVGARSSPSNAYQVELKPKPWVAIAKQLAKAFVNVCSLGDGGQRFYETAFGVQAQPKRAAAMVGLLQRIEILEATGKQDPALRYMLDRSRALSEVDLVDLTDNFWRCLGNGCQTCQALEMSGICMTSWPESVRTSLLTGFGQALQVYPSQLEAWFGALGLGMPPALGWGLTDSEMRARIVGREQELTDILGYPPLG